MRIKNTRELVLRARSHHRFDHFEQMRYGYVTQRRADQGCSYDLGDFKGCAVGCLSTPHRKADFVNYWNAIVKDGTAKVEGGPCDCGAPGCNATDEYWIEPSETFQANRLSEEFGMTKALVGMAEAFFEGQLSVRAGADFVKRFAEALNEGANITPSQVEAFSNRLLGVVASDYDHVENLSLSESELDQKTDEFIAWLKTRKPKATAATPVPVQA